jgi:uncharacterized protein YggE
MKKMILTVTAVLFAATALVAQSPQPQYENAIQVSGKAEKRVTPDEIYVSITIKDGDVKNQTVAQIESTMKSRLKALDIDVEKNLKATDMGNTLKKRNQVDTRRFYELKVGDVGTLVAVFDMLNELGVANASVTRVSHSQIEEFRKEVRLAAIKNAKTNAEEIASAIGQSIGPAVYIGDNGNSREGSDLVIVGYGVTRKASDEQSLDFKEITLSYQITAKFVLKSE